MAVSGSSILSNVFEEESAFSKICPDLTYNQRIIGFVSCIGIGWILSLMGTLVLIGGMDQENIKTFIALYIVGTVSKIITHVE